MYADRSSNDNNDVADLITLEDDVCADNTAKSEEIYTLEAITEYRVVFT
jgi:hypothetical protein